MSNSCIRAFPPAFPPIVDLLGRRRYTPPHMNGVSSRMAFLSHLLITIPAIAVTPLVVYFGLYMFGPDLLLYYICAALALSWQWYSIAVPIWKESLRRKSVQENEIEKIQRSSGLLWPGASTIGPFALHTTIAAVCALRVGPWLVGHWFAWILPLSGRTSPTGSTAYSDYYLQHLELLSTLPALAVGCIVCRCLPKLATWAWILPTLILVLQTFDFHRSTSIGIHLPSAFALFVLLRDCATHAHFYRSSWF